MEAGGQGCRQSSPGEAARQGGLTAWSSSKSSWQHSQKPFLLLGRVRAADRRLGSRSLGSLGKARGRGGGSDQDGALRGADQDSWAGTHRPAPTWGAGEATRKVRAPGGHPVPSLPPQGKAQVRPGAGASRNASQDRCSSSSHPNPRPSALHEERGKASVAARGLCCSRPPLPTVAFPRLRRSPPSRRLAPCTAATFTKDSPVSSNLTSHLNFRPVFLVAAWLAEQTQQSPK